MRGDPVAPRGALLCSDAWFLALIGLAVTASPALADYWWHSHMKQGSATALRTPGRCSIRAGSDPGSLRITCPSHHSASLTYLFPASHGVDGHAGSGSTPGARRR